jgi:hypothetical protein
MQLQGIMSKRGHHVKNWKERWMVLTPTDLKYYVSSHERNLKGTIVFDKSQTVEVIHITIYCTRFYLFRTFPILSVKTEQINQS